MCFHVSGSDSVSSLRGPFDVVNMGQLLKLTTEQVCFAYYIHSCLIVPFRQSELSVIIVRSC